MQTCEYDFHERLAFSVGSVGDTCEETILSLIPGAVTVEKSAIEDDRNGIDYWVTLRRGAKIGIDLKARDKGCSKFWANGPELSLETWSVKPTMGHTGTAGWTLSESKNTDYTLHTFHKSDTDKCYLLPFQLLRVAFRTNYLEWTTAYRRATQSSGAWESECVFIPASVVTDAVSKIMVG